MHAPRHRNEVPTVRIRTSVTPILAWTTSTARARPAYLAGVLLECVQHVPGQDSVTTNEIYNKVSLANMAIPVMCELQG